MIFTEMEQGDYEQLVFCQDKASGLKAIICIHDTTLGPALGGIRFWNYEHEEEAITDVLRLAKGMTYKNAAAGLNLGGGKAVVIGGGIGVFPILQLARKTEGAVFLGFRTKDLVVMEDEFKAAHSNVTICTDDGSYGYDGFAIAAMGEYLLENEVDMIYCCGPVPMLKTVQQIAEFRNIPCQLSLEQRMGCGIGACLTCVCETKDEGMGKYKQVCSCGPVFDAKEVVF